MDDQSPAEVEPNSTGITHLNSNAHTSSNLEKLASISSLETSLSIAG
jgi:hypothetical protein